MIRGVGRDNDGGSWIPSEKKENLQTVPSFFASIDHPFPISIDKRGVDV